MKYFEKDKAFKILFIIYILILAADLITTLRVELWQYLEANPLLKVGGLPLIMFLNLVFAGAYYWFYKKGSVNTRFYVMFSLIAVITTRLIVISQNLAVAADPPTIEQAMAVTQAVKTETIKRLVILNMLPFFNGIFAWLFFKVDHNISKKGVKDEHE